MQKNLSELKKRALLAKQRMKMGYWQQMERERERLLDKEGGVSDNYRQMISEMQRAVIRRDEGIIVKNPEVNREEELYLKVKEIIDNNEFAINPIGMLVNHDEYDHLDEGGKQRYILQLSKKYRELKERYHKERLGRKACE